jgi:phage-related protein
LANGSAPVLEFINGISTLSERAALLADLELLQDHGPALPFPWTAAIRSHRNLRELRTRIGQTQYRVLYGVFDERVLLIHAFRKEAQSSVRLEYSVAAERLLRLA